MPPLVCPSCKHTNPDVAVYCFYDGALLRPGQPGAHDRNRLGREFYFPSGRRCNSYDELVTGCQEEWAVARDLLKRGMFGQYFASVGRMDLVRASQEAQSAQDPDIGLTTFLGSLPVSAKLQGPKLDIQPRKLDLGRVRPGETRRVDLKILNVGQGTLQGSVSVIEGGEWLHIGEGGGIGQCAVQAPREQIVRLTVDTRSLQAAQTYGGKLRIITNGGVDEVPLQVELEAHAFQRPPFQGARTPRELAQKMRDNPKAAVALLESGELVRWFAANGWNFPVSGQVAQGVAGVQQFFEAMGLSKPPPVKLSQPAVRLTCVVPERPRFQVTLFTPVKKWVYGNVVSDVPWLSVVTPSVSGAQKAPITFEVEPRCLPQSPLADGVVQVVANGGQRLPLRVMVEVRRPARSFGRQLLQPLVTLALLFVLTRLVLAPFADLYARSAAVSIASQRAADVPPAADSPARSAWGWLQLPWGSVLLGNAIPFPDNFFGLGTMPGVNTENFRDFFVSNFVKILAACTWWLGAVAGGVLLFRRNGWKDGVWGLLSGGVLGLVAAATLACVMLLFDLFPLAIWGILFGASSSSWLHLLAWVLFASMWWALWGLIIGLFLLLLGPFGRAILVPAQEAVAGLFRACGLRGLANFCAPE
jgi:hypothetical protein